MTTSEGAGPSGAVPRGEPGQPDDEQRSEQERRARARRRRHIDDVFGTVLPAVTNDERAPGERGGFSAEHYRANRPPHHGG